MTNLKVAVVGYGHLGKWHCQKVEATGMAKLHAIVDPFPSSQQAAKDLYPAVKVVSSIDEVLLEVDAVFIVTPTSLHFDLVKKVIQAGKHCFCEKPMTSTVTQAREISALLKTKNVVFQVGHSERCHQVWENFSPIFKEIDPGAQIKINRYAPFKGRATDVDVVQDLMIHDIDLLFYLFPFKPKTVEAFGLKSRSQYWDHVTAKFSYTNGTVAFLTVGRSHVKEVRELEVVHQKGCTLVDLFQNKFLINRVDSLEIEEGSYPKRDHLLFEHQTFYSSILNKDPIWVDVEAGVTAVIAVEAVVKSIELGQPLALEL